VARIRPMVSERLIIALSIVPRSYQPGGSDSAVGSRRSHA
jgi:hypothetical protein